MSARGFSSSARAFLRWAGFDKTKLTPEWELAVNKFSEPGGKAEAKLGKLREIFIKVRDGNPVHQSHFNRADKEEVISARVTGENGTRTCHIYRDGSGTTKKGGEKG